MIVKSDFLSETEISVVLKQILGKKETWELLKVEVKKFDGLAGFLGDHYRISLHVSVRGVQREIKLFVKAVPAVKSRAELVHDRKFFIKEAFTLQLLEDISSTDINPWYAPSYLKNNKIVVMPDLAEDGYKSRAPQLPDDLAHANLTVHALARFHAAFANYETKKIKQFGPTYNFEKEYGDKLEENLFRDNSSLRAGIQLHKNFLQALSNRYSDIDVDLVPTYLDACSTVRSYDNTLNTLIHRDLWANNVMFKYKNGVPTSALLVDFQIVRYAPPAYDAMLFLYMGMTQQFREQHGDLLLRHYFLYFLENVNMETKRRLEDLRYDWYSFRDWCEKARMFALVGAMHICPFGLLDPTYGEKVFNNQETFQHYWHNDRATPIVGFAKQNIAYKERLLQLYEEFVERYV